MRITATQPTLTPAAPRQRAGGVAGVQLGRRGEDQVELSDEALAGTVAPETVEENAAAPTEHVADDTDAHDEELTPEEEQVVTELKRRDAEVRAHERAHASAGGGHAGSPQYEFQAGPDGQKYAVGGEVSISVSPVEGDPEATIQKMQTVRAAALAPAQPSGQDRAVAAQAARLQVEARAQQAEEALASEGEPDAVDGVRGSTEPEDRGAAGDVDSADTESTSGPQSRAAHGAYARAAQIGGEATDPERPPVSLMI